MKSWIRNIAGITLAAASTVAMADIDKRVARRD